MYEPRWENETVWIILQVTYRNMTSISSIFYNGSERDCIYYEQSKVIINKGEVKGLLPNSNTDEE